MNLLDLYSISGPAPNPERETMDLQGADFCLFCVTHHQTMPILRFAGEYLEVHIEAKGHDALDIFTELDEMTLKPGFYVWEGQSKGLDSDEPWPGIIRDASIKDLEASNLWNLLQ